MTEPDSGKSAKTNRQQGCYGSNSERIVHGNLPIGIGEKVPVMFQGKALDFQPEHFRCECKIIAGIETEGHDDQNGEHEEEKNQSTNDPENVIPGLV